MEDMMFGAEALPRRDSMEPEQKFVVVTVIVLVMLSLLSLGGCDYWPPALQAEIAGLRAHLNDVLDENAKLYEELAALKAAAARPSRELELRTNLPGLPQSRPSADADAGSDDALPLHRTAPSPALVPARKVTKRPPFYLTLTQPPQRGAEVVKLQRLLRRHDRPVRIDGVYGTETARAIRTFQRIRHLTPDGIAGPATYAALRQPP
jgi:murein L,D-transpeptidase YcbB/YkuD